MWVLLQILVYTKNLREKRQPRRRSPADAVAPRLPYSTPWRGNKGLTANDRTQHRPLVCTQYGTHTLIVCYVLAFSALLRCCPCLHTRAAYGVDPPVCPPIPAAALAACWRSNHPKPLTSPRRLSSPLPFSRRFRVFPCNSAAFFAPVGTNSFVAQQRAAGRSTTAVRMAEKELPAELVSEVGWLVYSSAAPSLSLVFLQDMRNTCTAVCTHPAKRTKQSAKARVRTTLFVDGGTIREL